MEKIINAAKIEAQTAYGSDCASGKVIARKGEVYYSHIAILRVNNKNPAFQGMRAARRALVGATLRGFWITPSLFPAFC